MVDGAGPARPRARGPFRWGIVATGNVASDMAAALEAVPDAEVVAVGSGSARSAERFGDRFRIARRYPRYSGVARDPDVEIAYIATPNDAHLDNVLECLRAGKHVLCEKPLTLDAAQAAECVHLARENELFLMEAVWMRFFPAFGRLQALLADGVIGDVRMVRAEACINVPFDPRHRVFDPARGGGALLDLGVYPLSLTTSVLGFPASVAGRTEVGPTGVDELTTIVLRYESGATARLTCGVRVSKPIEATVVGTRGSIVIHDRFLSPSRLTVHEFGRSPSTVNLPYEGNGYAHEVHEVHACLRSGRTESQLMPLDETLGTMRLMDEIRRSWRLNS
ncbi:MAG: Gfo/Idh/MocA family oxidoreductase [Acidimicrobiaceae bacterium]|nr:Gfo/Idh/MocA family oxidoreductase [Acidimicrobiaceae bacterium]MDE0515101.1 Gfo/Idh/MocA family oxidoreductase [Acidimicrobiaceae bacterium]MDE0655709.1 Gfo/Idh/MocA family oxidoreductase [Acidimicrobiaceae bacterium]